MRKKSVQKTIRYGHYRNEILLTTSHLMFVYNKTSAKVFIKNLTKIKMLIAINYYDGNSKTLELEKDEVFYIDQKEATLNNQQLAVSNCTISLPNLTYIFDYNNVCEFNDYKRQNTILISFFTDRKLSVLEKIRNFFLE